MSRTFLSLAEKVGVHKRILRRIFHAYTPYFYRCVCQGKRGPIYTRKELLLINCSTMC